MLYRQSSETHMSGPTAYSNGNRNSSVNARDGVKSQGGMSRFTNYLKSGVGSSGVAISKNMSGIGRLSKPPKSGQTHRSTTGRFAKRTRDQGLGFSAADIGSMGIRVDHLMADGTFMANF